MDHVKDHQMNDEDGDELSQAAQNAEPGSLGSPEVMCCEKKPMN